MTENVNMLHLVAEKHFFKIWINVSYLLVLGIGWSDCYCHNHPSPKGQNGTIKWNVVRNPYWVCIDLFRTSRKSWWSVSSVMNICSWRSLIVSVVMTVTRIQKSRVWCTNYFRNIRGGFKWSQRHQFSRNWIEQSLTL